MKASIKKLCFQEASSLNAFAKREKVNLNTGVIQMKKLILIAIIYSSQAFADIADVYGFCETNVSGIATEEYKECQENYEMRLKQYESCLKEEDKEEAIKCLKKVDESDSYFRKVVKGWFYRSHGCGFFLL